MEATQFYAGLPSGPRMLSHTNPILWQKPKGPEAYHKLKQLRVLVNHKLNTNWENEVAPKVLACLEELKVEWTSLDIVRIGEVEASSDPTLWIGVKPKSLTTEDANTTAFRCLDVLKTFNIIDVNVELRESLVIRSAGPKLLPPALPSNPTEDVRHPLTHALGLHISAQATPFCVGTGGFFMAEGGGSNKLLLITARHVVLPFNGASNNKFEGKNTSKARFNVLLLGDQAYENCLASIKAKIREHGMIVEFAQRRIEAYQEQDDEEVNVAHEAAQGEINAAEKAMNILYALYNDVNKNWATTDSRVLGYVVCSPPIRLGAGTVDEQYTEDYAIIEVDDDKIDRSKFMGNMIDLGTKIPPWEFIDKIYPNSENTTSFNYPVNRLLKLRGTISDDEMRNPTMLDKNGLRCLIVIKNGSASGTTIGRASGIMSYVREYFEDGSHQTSKEWAILPYDTKSGAFSAPGDSGAVVVDGQGRIGGLLTGGSGIADSIDITYVTPIGFLLMSIKANGYPNAHPNPA
jgi:hypothetical protein